MMRPDATPEEFDKEFMRWLDENNVTPLLSLLDKDGPARQIRISTKTGEVTVVPTKHKRLRKLLYKLACGDGLIARWAKRLHQRLQ